MHRSSYSAITIGPAFSPQAGQAGSRRTLKVRKALVHRVVRQESTDQWVTEFQQQLDGLDGLDRSDDARQDAQHARLGATRREFRRRRLGDHAAIARSDVGVEDGDLSLEAEDRTVHDRDVLDERGVVHQIARREVVGAVDDDVVAVDDVQDVVGAESRVVGEDLDVRVHRGERHLRAVDLAHADAFDVVQDLALEVRGVDDVHVDDADRADAGRGEIERRRRTESAGAEQEHLGVQEPLLALLAHFGQ